MELGTARATLVALVTLAAGCGGSGGGGEQAPQGGGQAPAPPAAAAAAPAPAGAGAGEGRAVFTRTCAACHQQDGRGLAGSFPPIAGSHIATGDKARLIRLVLHGLQGPIVVEGRTYNNVMPPWKALSDAELAAVLTFVRSNFGNAALAVTAAEVAAERAATASRTTMWTARELGL